MLNYISLGLVSTLESLEWATPLPHLHLMWDGVGGAWDGHEDMRAWDGGHGA